MSANGAKGNLLCLSIDFVEKSFMSKCTVISVIVFDGAIRLCDDYSKALTARIVSSIV